MLARMRRKGNPPTLLVGMQAGAPLWKTAWRFLKKLKIELPYNLAIALLGIYPIGTNVGEHLPHPHVHSGNAHYNQTMERVERPINR